MTSIQRFAQITAAFDPEDTRTLGQAFDMSCALLGHTPQPTAVREAIAKSIIEAAKTSFDRRAPTLHCCCSVRLVLPLAGEPGRAHLPEPVHGQSSWRGR
jgi:hypothetical protein